MQVRRPKALIGVRVSVYREDDDGVSPEQQRDSCESYLGNMGWDMVGVFDDLDVSASVEPAKRPGFGPWITDRTDEWEILVVTKSDRLFRSTYDCVVFCRWLEEHRKALVLVESRLTLDFRTDADPLVTTQSKMMLLMGTVFAEMELGNIKDRFRKAHSYLRTTTRWAGGKPPFGYKSTDHPTDKGRILVKDPETSEIVREMGKMLVAGMSQWEIADTLTARGIPAPRNGAGVKRWTAEWNGVTIGYILRSPATMGLKVSRQGSGPRTPRVLRDENTLPIKMADPIFSDAEWAEIQQTLDRRSNKSERTKNASPLLGVAYCSRCNGRLYSDPGNPARGIKDRYKCKRTKTKAACPGVSFLASSLHEVLDTLVAEDLSDIRQVERVFVKGSDTADELQFLEQVVADVREEWDTGVYPRSQRADYLARVKKLTEQIETLRAVPSAPSRWEEREKKETYAEAYARMGQEERRQLLMNAGIKLICEPGHIRLYVPGDLKSRLPTLSVVVA